MLECIPFISKHELSEAAEEIAACAEEIDLGRNGFRVCTSPAAGSAVLSIRREVPARSRPVQSQGRGDERAVERLEDEEQGEINEVDEAVVTSDEVGTGQMLKVRYDICHSTTYQVPLLYFRLENRNGQENELDLIYRYLVVCNEDGALRDVGPLGGISKANHPVDELPSFFVHPCLTPDAMRELCGTEPMNGTKYVLRWIGIIGSSVGLSLPKELVLRIENRRTGQKSVP